MENKEVAGSVEIVVDSKNITIPQERYEALLRAETERDIVRQTYQTQESYQYDYIFLALFGPKPQESEK